MNDIEKIKFGNDEFNLVVGGIELSDDGGKITFQMGNFSFDEIKRILKESTEIVKLGLTEKVEWVRSDLIYAGKMKNVEDYNVGIVGDDGTSDIKVEVIIAEFKLPDLNESLNQRISALEKGNEAMKESLGTLLLTELGGK